MPSSDRNIYQTTDDFNKLDQYDHSLSKLLTPAPKATKALNLTSVGRDIMGSHKKLSSKNDELKAIEESYLDYDFN